MDAQPSQKKFAQELGLEYRLLSDFPDKQVSREYGVLSERGFSRRTTFVIDKTGTIRHIDSGRNALDIAGVKSTCSQLK